MICAILTREDGKDEWERLMEEDGVPDYMDEPGVRYDLEDEWEQRLREEGAADGEAAEHWGWGRYAMHRRWKEAFLTGLANSCATFALVQCSRWMWQRCIDRVECAKSVTG